MTQKFISVSLVGRPNAGKSTLLNSIVGEKLSIVTHKAQTTRRAITGICCYNECQIVFYDAPGLFEPNSKLETKIVKNAKNSISINDMIFYLIDITTLDIDQLKTDYKLLRGKNLSFVLNKVDLVKKEKIEEVSLLLEPFAHRIFTISALKNEGVYQVLDFISSQAEEMDWLYPADQVTTMPERELAAEITREKLFLKTHQEVPYSATVETDTWKEKDGMIEINQTIYVKRESHKKIVIGKGGESIKNIGILARQELEQIYSKKINLILFVKVSPRWDETSLI
jgi:GTP-binding protein Era